MNTQKLEKFILDFCKAVIAENESCDRVGKVDKNAARRATYRLKKMNAEAERLGIGRMELQSMVNKINGALVEERLRETLRENEEDV